MNKPTAIIFGDVGALMFLVSAARPQLVAEAGRFLGWQHRWR
jgi:hypothetical protein